MYKLLLLAAMSACAFKGSLLGSQLTPSSQTAPAAPSSQAAPAAATQSNEADAAAAEQARTARYETDREISSAARNARELISHLEAARSGKIYSSLISFEHRDADYIERRLQSVKDEMPELDKIAKSCASGATKDSELCDIAKNRDKYFAKMLALQFDAIFATRIEAWTNTLEKMRSEGLVAVVNYNVISNKKALSADLGKDLSDIGKVLGQSNTKVTIDARLTKLHDEFKAAVKEQQGRNVWSEHASTAKHQDVAVTRAVKDIDGLSVVRVGVTSRAWEIIRGNFNQPVQRNKYVWALMQKRGETFCRLYPFTVVQDHEGGGRYGSAHAESFGPAEFYVSKCR